MGLPFTLLQPHAEYLCSILCTSCNRKELVLSLNLLNFPRITITIIRSVNHNKLNDSEIFIGMQITLEKSSFMH